jgi:hypothetical protein
MIVLGVWVSVDGVRLCAVQAQLVDPVWACAVEVVVLACARV